MSDFSITSSGYASNKLCRRRSVGYQYRETFISQLARERSSCLPLRTLHTLVVAKTNGGRKTRAIEQEQEQAQIKQAQKHHLAYQCDTYLITATIT